MATTTDKGVPYPEQSDYNNVPRDLQAIAEWLDARPGVSSLTTSQRDALTGVALWEGRVIYNLSETRVEVYDGDDWVEIEGGGGGEPIPGPPNVLSIGTVTTGAPGDPASATITGTSPSQVLNLTIPAGEDGEAGPANTLSIGTVTTGTPGSPASATITGTAPTQTLNLTIPAGDSGASDEFLIPLMTQDERDALSGDGLWDGKRILNSTTGRLEWYQEFLDEWHSSSFDRGDMSFMTSLTQGHFDRLGEDELWNGRIVFNIDQNRLLAHRIYSNSSEWIEFARSSEVANVADAIDNKADISNPVFTGTPMAPTPSLFDDPQAIVNKQYVENVTSSKADINSPIFTGTPRVPNMLTSTSGTEVANAAFVHSAISSYSPIDDDGIAQQPIDMDGYSLTGLDNPVVSNEAANKGYVDTQVATKMSASQAAGGDLSGNLPDPTVKNAAIERILKDLGVWRLANRQVVTTNASGRAVISHSLGVSPGYAASFLETTAYRSAIVAKTSTTITVEVVNAATGALFAGNIAVSWEVAP